MLLAKEIHDPAGETGLLAFLASRPEMHLPLFSAIEGRRGRILAVRGAANGLLGAALLEEDGLAYLSTQDPRAARALGRALSRQHIDTLLADREVGDRAWRSMCLFSPRLILDQALYALSPDRLAGPFEALPLRPATIGELDRVQEIAHAMFWEEVGLPPSLPSLRTHLREEIAEGSLLLAEEEGAILFLARVAVRCSAGAELQRVYTAPERRREGIASRAIATLCQNLFQTLPRVVLRVNESNHAAMRLYQSLGFSRVGRIRLYCR